MNCFESYEMIEEFDLLVSETSEFDLTEDRVYAARCDASGESINVVNDKGIELEYSIEHFRFYNGEKIK